MMVQVLIWKLLLVQQFDIEASDDVTVGKDASDGTTVGTDWSDGNTLGVFDSDDKTLEANSDGKTDGEAYSDGTKVGEEVFSASTLSLVLPLCMIISSMETTPNTWISANISMHIIADFWF